MSSFQEPLSVENSWGLDWGSVPSESFLISFCQATQDYFRPVPSFHINFHLGHSGSIQRKASSNCKQSHGIGLWLQMLRGRSKPSQSPVPCPGGHNAFCSTASKLGNHRVLIPQRALSCTSLLTWTQASFFALPSTFEVKHAGSWNQGGNRGISFHTFSSGFQLPLCFWPFFLASSAMDFQGFWLHLPSMSTWLVQEEVLGDRIDLFIKIKSPPFVVFTSPSDGVSVIFSIFRQTQVPLIDWK